MDHLLNRLAVVAPGNTAQIPVAVSQELTEDGTMLWVVDIHVRIPRITEYDLTTSAPSYAVALKKAVASLNSESRIRRHANWANERFGVAV